MAISIPDIKDETKVLATTTNTNDSNIKNDELEEKLKNILSKIEGVGKVDVLLTYYETNKVEAIKTSTKVRPVFLFISLYSHN